MNDKERITQLETMLTEEREKVSHVLGILESYARGLDMMARMAYAEAPAGSRDEKNASSLKQHTADMLGWLEMKADELRDLMRRPLPAATAFGLTEAMIEELAAYLPSDATEGLPEAPEPPAPPPLAEDTERPLGVTIH